jgi:hypothetical protein
MLNVYMLDAIILIVILLSVVALYKLLKTESKQMARKKNFSGIERLSDDLPCSSIIHSWYSQQISRSKLW